MDTPLSDLSEEQFYTTLRISMGTLCVTNKSKDQLVDEYIQEYLSVLPKGTEVVSITQGTITGLYLPIIVVFSNPLMQKYEHVELEHTYESVVINDKIEQFRLLTGIKYTKR